MNLISRVYFDVKYDWFGGQMKLVFKNQSNVLSLYLHLVNLKIILISNSASDQPITVFFLQKLYCKFFWQVYCIVVEKPNLQIGCKMHMTFIKFLDTNKGIFTCLKAVQESTMQMVHFWGSEKRTMLFKLDFKSIFGCKIGLIWG